MNYHKKLLSIGFKKSKEAIVMTSTSWSSKDCKLLPISKIKEPGLSYSMQMDLSSKLETYIWKIDSFVTMYITTSKLDFCCFLEVLKETVENKYSFVPCKITSIIHTGKFNDTFWKEIISELPKDIKREVLLKQIL